MDLLQLISRLGLQGDLYFNSETYFGLVRVVKKPVPVAMRSKAQVYGRSPAETVGSIPTGDMDVCPLSVLCVVR